MQKDFTIARKDFPFAKSFPNYRKTRVRVVVAEQTTVYDLNWSGGTKNEYHAICLETGEVKTMDAWGLPAPWNNPREGQTLEIIPGFAVAVTGHFCGKPSTMAVYVHPYNVVQFLPAE